MKKEVSDYRFDSMIANTAEAVDSIIEGIQAVLDEVELSDGERECMNNAIYHLNETNDELLYAYRD